MQILHIHTQLSSLLTRIPYSPYALKGVLTMAHVNINSGNQKCPFNAIKAWLADPRSAGTSGRAASVDGARKA